MEPTTRRTGLRRELSALLVASVLFASLLASGAFLWLDQLRRGASTPSVADDPLFWLLSLSAFACSLLFAGILALLARRRLSRELDGLTAAVTQLAEQHDFHARLGSWSGDLRGLAGAIDALLSAMDARSRELTRQRRELSELHAARRRELDKKRRELRFLLEHVEQGVLLLEPESMPHAERSACFDRWFGAPAPGETVGQVLARVSAGSDPRFSQNWSRLLDGFLPVELELLSLPSTFTAPGDRHFHVACRADCSATGRFERLLVLVADVTAEVRRQRSEAEQAQLVSLLEHLAYDRLSFAAELHELDAMMHRVTMEDDTPRAELACELRTLGQRLAALGLPALSRLVRELEERCSEPGWPPCPEERLRLEQAWELFARRARTLLGEPVTVTERPQLSALGPRS